MPAYGDPNDSLLVIELEVGKVAIDVPLDMAVELSRQAPRQAGGSDKPPAEFLHLPRAPRNRFDRWCH